jgi:hypothetical protein
LLADKIDRPSYFPEPLRTRLKRNRKHYINI